MENFLPSFVGSNVCWETFGNRPFLPVKEFVAQKKPLHVGASEEGEEEGLGKGRRNQCKGNKVNENARKTFSSSATTGSVVGDAGQRIEGSQCVQT